MPLVKASNLKPGHVFTTPSRHWSGMDDIPRQHVVLKMELELAELETDKQKPFAVIQVLVGPTILLLPSEKVHVTEKSHDAVAARLLASERESHQSR